MLEGTPGAGSGVDVGISVSRNTSVNRVSIHTPMPRRSCIAMGSEPTMDLVLGCTDLGPPVSRTSILQ